MSHFIVIFHISLKCAQNESVNQCAQNWISAHKMKQLWIICESCAQNESVPSVRTITWSLWISAISTDGTYIICSFDNSDLKTQPQPLKISTPKHSKSQPLANFLDFPTSTPKSQPPAISTPPFQKNLIPPPSPPPNFENLNPKNLNPRQMFSFFSSVFNRRWFLILIAR